MAMNLCSKGTKNSSRTSDPQSGGHGATNSTNLTPTPEVVVTFSTSDANTPQQSDDRLVKLDEVQRGWAKQVHACFTTGACVPWNSFQEEFKNITWA